MFPWVGICHSYWSSEIKMVVQKNMVPDQLLSIWEIEHLRVGALAYSQFKHLSKIP